MSLILFDFECEGCRAVFEELVERDAPAGAKCPKCHQPNARRLISGTRIDRSLGVSTDFPSLASKWERNRAEHQRIEERHYREHGG